MRQSGPNKERNKQTNKLTTKEQLQQQQQNVQTDFCEIQKHTNSRKQTSREI